MPSRVGWGSAPVHSPTGPPWAPRPQGVFFRPLCPLCDASPSRAAQGIGFVAAWSPVSGFMGSLQQGSITNTACAVSRPPVRFAALLRSAYDGPAFSQVPHQSSGLRGLQERISPCLALGDKTNDVYI